MNAVLEIENYPSVEFPIVSNGSALVNKNDIFFPKYDGNESLALHDGIVRLDGRRKVRVVFRYPITISKETILCIPANHLTIIED